MSNNSKRNGRRESSQPQLNRLNYLVASLGTPDGLRALSELVSNLACASAIFLLLLGKYPFGETLLRIAAALALSKPTLRIGGNGQN